jgi:hypothetical protein
VTQTPSEMWESASTCWTILSKPSIVDSSRPKTVRRIWIWDQF